VYCARRPPLDEYIADGLPVRVVDVFVEELDLRDLGFEGAAPDAAENR
jgi:transposase